MPSILHETPPPQRRDGRSVPRFVVVALGIMVAGVLAPVELVPANSEWASPGNVVVSFDDGRQYWLHLPPAAELGKALPLLVFLHPALFSAHEAQAYYGLDAAADRYGFVVAYPQGTPESAASSDHTWNAMHCCGTAFDANVADVEFLARVVADIRSRTPILQNATTVAGHSNGAMMSYRFAAEAPGMVHRIVAVAGSLGGQRNASSPVLLPFGAATSLSTLILHAYDDDIVRYDGGANHSPYDPERVDAPVHVAVAWARAGIQPTRNESWTIHEVRYDAYVGLDAQVLLVSYRGGHGWPDGHHDMPDATELVARFVVAPGLHDITSRANPISP